MLRINEQLSVTFNTAGWKTVIKPLLDKMINDCLGYKTKDGSWVAGALQKGHLEPEEAKFYSAALIEFETHLNDHVNIAREIKTSLTKDKKEETFTMPLKDTRYAL